MSILRDKKNIRKMIKWLVLLLCIISLLLLTIAVFSDRTINGDTKGYNFIANNLINQNITPTVKFITNLGSGFFLIIVSTLSILILKDKRISLSIVFNLVIITLLNLFIKNVFQRPRPVEYPLFIESGYSFPSGHAMISMAFYGYLIYLIYKFIKNKLVKWVTIVLLSVLILSIGISRIYLGVHYISDVIAGLLIAIIYLIIYTSYIGAKFISKRK